MTFQANEIHTFLMPDYYPAFSCKMGACRSACCVGWPISVSMENYFRLLGMDCPRPLREKLDCGLRVYDHPTKERYAFFAPNYSGDCPLRMPDGRCSLHAEMGEEVLPDICRLYPRGIRKGGGLYECSCANSCEAVLELLFTKREPITFLRKPLTVKLPEIPEQTAFSKSPDFEQRFRLYLISVIQNREVPLPDRIAALGGILDKMDLLKSQDEQGMEALLAPVSLEKQSTESSVADLRSGLTIAEKLLERLGEQSQSIEKYAAAALEYFEGGDGVLQKYRSAKAHFEALFPNWEVFFEHWLVNHLYFSRFPFTERLENMHSSFVSICALYALLRFLSLGYMAKRNRPEDLIDAVAGAFRFVEHTAFDRYVSHLQPYLGCAAPKQLQNMILL